MKFFTINGGKNKIKVVEEVTSEIYCRSGKSSIRLNRNGATIVYKAGRGEFCGSGCLLIPREELLNLLDCVRRAAALEESNASPEDNKSS